MRAAAGARPGRVCGFADLLAARLRSYLPVGTRGAGRNCRRKHGLALLVFVCGIVCQARGPICRIPALQKQSADRKYLLRRFAIRAILNSIQPLCPQHLFATYVCGWGVAGGGRERVTDQVPQTTAQVTG